MTNAAWSTHKSGSTFSTEYGLHVPSEVAITIVFQAGWITSKGKFLQERNSNIYGFGAGGLSCMYLMPTKRTYPRPHLPMSSSSENGGDSCHTCRVALHPSLQNRPLSFLALMGNNDAAAVALSSVRPPANLRGQNLQNVGNPSLQLAAL